MTRRQAEGLQKLMRRRGGGVQLQRPLTPHSVSDRARKKKEKDDK